MGEILKYLSLSLSLFLILFSCSLMASNVSDIDQLTSKLNIMDRSGSSSESISKSMQILNLIEKNSQEVFSSITNKIKKKVPVNGHQLDLVHRIVSNYLGVNAFIFSKFEKYNASSAFNNQKTINKDIIWLSAHIKMIETFNNVFRDLFLSESKLRRLIDSTELLYKVKNHQLRKIIKRISSARHIVTVRKMLKKYNKHKFISSKNKFDDYLSSQDVQTLILDQKLFRSFREKYSGRIFSDFISNTTKFTTNQLSGLFGNAVGSVHFRKGYLKEKLDVIDEIRDTLKPLDIITEKTGFALTDKFIPGHFGHNALYLGTKEQLEKINMWNHPSIKPLQEKIENGYVIIEALRSGTHLTTIDDFMNIDEFAILRNINVLEHENQMFNIYRIALGQLGKRYDFNFDVETTDKIVCSELLYQAFDHINWETKKIAGRFTISPDEVAVAALQKDSPIKLIYFVTAKKEKVIYKTVDDLAQILKYSFNKEKNIYESVKTKCKYKDMTKDNKFNKCVVTIKELRYKKPLILEEATTEKSYEFNINKIIFPKWMTKPAFIIKN